MCGEKGNALCTPPTRSNKAPSNSVLILFSRVALWLQKMRARWAQKMNRKI